MKLPNGYGSVRKLSGKRRNPWMVQKTVAMVPDIETKKLKQVRKTIGYYPTRSAALQALADYNQNPYDLDSRKITFSEVYQKWSEKKFSSISESNVHGYKASYKLCTSLYDMPFVDIKLDHLQNVVDNSGKNYPTLRKLRVLFSQLFEYAVIHEIIPKERDMTEYLDISGSGNPNSIDRTPFTSSEIDTVWKNENLNEYVSVILMMIYSGCRVSELLELKKDLVFLDENYFYIDHAKTDAGIRPVPIASKTKRFFEYWMNKNDCEYLLSTPEGEPFQYRNYYDSYWKPLLKEMNIEHRPHDTRHTCASLLAAANVQQTTVKKILGHSGSQSLTEKVYTHLDVTVLLEAINLI